MYKMTCKMCGMTFAAQRKHTKYCSDACRTERDRQRTKECLERKKNEPKPEKYVPHLDEINHKARAAGMSYGKYVAEKYKERLKNEHAM